MKLTRDQVLHIAELAKLGLTEQETELFCEQLSEILNYASVLDQLDTESIPPTAQAIRRVNILREDVVCQSLSQEEALANAPQRRDGYFLVKPILES